MCSVRSLTFLLCKYLHAIIVFFIYLANTFLISLFFGECVGWSRTREMEKRTKSTKTGKKDGTKKKKEKAKYQLRR